MRDRVADVAFFTVLALHLALVWAFPVFPTQDGPAHLENAALLGRVLQHDPVALRFLALDRFSPNWLSQLVLLPLMGVFPLAIAEKILLSLATIGLPLGFRSALGSLGGPRVLALLVLPFVHNFLFSMGFTNFAIGVGLAFFVMGRAVAEPPVRPVRNLALGALGVYLCHPVAFGFLAGTLVLLAAFRGRETWRPTIGVLAPAAIFFALFLGGGAHEAGGVGGTARPAVFGTLGVLVSYAPSEVKLSTLFWMLLGAVGLFETARLVSQRSWRDGLLLAAVALLAAFFVVPFSVGGGAYLPERFLFLGALTLALWIGTRAPGELLPPVLGGMGALVAVGLLTVRVGPVAERNEALDEYLSVGSMLPAEAVVVAVNGTRAGQVPSQIPKVDSLMHAVGYLAAERRLVELGNYQPDTGHFPLRYTAETNPFGRLMTRAEAEQAPPPVDLARYERETGIAVDYVLWWDRAQVEGEPAVAELEADLRAAYALVGTSSGGRMQVYRRQR
jgi:hypothetical protein